MVLVEPAAGCSGTSGSAGVVARWVWPNGVGEAGLRFLLD
jgi:hypothetical protein